MYGGLTRGEAGERWARLGALSGGGEVKPLRPVAC